MPVVAQLPAGFKIEATALLPPLAPDVEGGGEDSCTENTDLLPEPGAWLCQHPGVPAQAARACLFLVRKYGVEDVRRLPVVWAPQMGCQGWASLRLGKLLLCFCTNPWLA